MVQIHPSRPIWECGGMAYTLVLETNGETLEGSNPFTPTNFMLGLA